MSNVGQPGRPRMIAFYTMAGLITALATLEMVSHVIEDSVSPHRIHSLAHALVSIAILVAIGSQLRRPAHHIAGIQQLFVLAVAVAAASVASARTGGLEVILVVFVGLLAPLHPARQQLLHLGGVRFRTLAFAGLACVPLVIYALGQAGLQRAGFSSAHADPGHWAWMATLGLAIGVLAVLAAIIPSGRRIPGYTAAAMMAAFGAGSLMFAAEPSAIPAAWAVVSIVMSLAFIAVLETESSSTTSSTTTTVAAPSATAMSA